MTALASRAQLRMSFLRYALVTVPLILLLGISASRFAGAAEGDPGLGAALPLVCALLGVALAMILHARGARGRGLAVAAFLAATLLGLAWFPLFFGWRQVSPALGMSIGAIALTFVATLLLVRIRKAAALLMLPFLAWLCFGARLTYDTPVGPALAPAADSTDIAL